MIASRFLRSSLVVRLAVCIVPRVKIFRQLIPLLLLTAFLFTGCCDMWWFAPSKHYSRVCVTNPRGELVSEWIAVGHVWRTENNGYRFRALQRVSGPPYMQLARYPDGRIVEINGPNIHIIPCGIPIWVYQQAHQACQPAK